MLELYNMTNDIKRVPRYRYTGEYVLKPKGSVPIHEEHAYFYKPYAQIGVVVRVSKSSMPEQQVLDIKSENTPKSSEEPAVDKVNNTDDLAQDNNTITDITDITDITETKETEETNQKSEGNLELNNLELNAESGLSEDELAEIEDMSISELRDKATNMGINIKGIRKKEEIKNLILDKLSN